MYVIGVTVVETCNVKISTTIMGSVSFAATAGTSYTLRFRVVGTTLYARVWQTGTTEPTNWLITVTDTSLDRKSTRLNSSHANISYAVFCLKKKNLPGGTPTPTPSPSPSPSPSP